MPGSPAWTWAISLGQPCGVEDGDRARLTGAPGEDTDSQGERTYTDAATAPTAKQ